MIGEENNDFFLKKVVRNALLYNLKFYVNLGAHS